MILEKKRLAPILFDQYQKWHSSSSSSSTSWWQWNDHWLSSWNSSKLSTSELVTRASSQKRATCWCGFLTKLLRVTLWRYFFQNCCGQIVYSWQQSAATDGCVNSTLHTSYFLAPARAHFNDTSTLAQVWRAAHITLHPIFMRSWSGCSDSLRLSLPLLAVPLLSCRLFHPLGLQLLLPWCGWQVPCALSLMRTLAPLPSTTLSQVMRPTTCTSQRPLNCTSRNPPAITSPWTCMTWISMTTQSAEHSLHHCSLRSEKVQRAVDELITLLTKVCRPVSRRLSVIEQGDLLSDHFDSLISTVRENPRRSAENEQIRILLERQRQQILADCEAEIQKDEFQADYDRRSIQKLNGVIESQRGEIHRAHQGDEQHRRDQQLLHEQLLEQNRHLREAHEKSDFKALHSIQIRGEIWSKIKILSLNSQARFRNYRTRLIVWMIQEIFKMVNQYAVEIHTLPVNQCLSHFIQFLVEC